MKRIFQTPHRTSFHECYMSSLLRLSHKITYRGHFHRRWKCFAKREKQAVLATSLFRPPPEFYLLVCILYPSNFHRLESTHALCRVQRWAIAMELWTLKAGGWELLFRGINTIRVLFIWKCTICRFGSLRRAEQLLSSLTAPLPWWSTMQRLPKSYRDLAVPVS